MTIVSRLIALFIAATLVFGSVSAKDTSQETRVALIETVAAFDEAMREKDMATVIGMIPQKVLAAMAEKSNMTSEKLVGLVVTSMARVFEQVEIIDFGMETDDFEIKETENGIAYTFLPTTTVIETDGTKVETKSQTLALRDEGTWSLMRVDDVNQLTILRGVYPGFANIEFGKGTTKILN